jgi:hypothetical protein
VGWRAALLDDGLIDDDAWERARAGFVTVAECRCGGAMRAEPVEVVGRIRWYTAICTTCSGELTAPNGRVRPPREPIPAAHHAGGGLRADLVDPRRPGESDAV